MALTITSASITSDVVEHTAWLMIDGRDWTSTTHPSHRFTRDQAITAMACAEHRAVHGDDAHTAAWESELASSGPKTDPFAGLTVKDDPEWPTAS
jgi:hypothetical protein